MLTVKATGRSTEFPVLLEEAAFRPYVREFVEKGRLAELVRSDEDGPGRNLEAFPVPWPVPEPVPEIGLLHWPVFNASRYAYGVFLLDGYTLGQLRLELTAAGGGNKVTLSYFDDPDDAFETPRRFVMHLLSARPLVRTTADPLPVAPVLPPAADDAWVCVFVDARYYWMTKTGVNKAPDWVPVSWTELLSTLAGSLPDGPGLAYYDTPPASYLRPTARWAGGGLAGKSTTWLLDSAAIFTGGRIVYLPDGTLGYQRPTDANRDALTAAHAVLAAANRHSGGGPIADADILPGLPAVATVVFYDPSNHDCERPTVVEVPVGCNVPPAGGSGSSGAGTVCCGDPVASVDGSVSGIFGPGCSPCTIDFTLTAAGNWSTTATSDCTLNGGQAELLATLICDAFGWALVGTFKGWEDADPIDYSVSLVDDGAGTLNGGGEFGSCGWVNFSLANPCAASSGGTGSGGSGGSGGTPPLTGHRVYAWLDIPGTEGESLREAAAAQWACDWYNWQRVCLDATYAGAVAVPASAFLSSADVFHDAETMWTKFVRPPAGYCPVTTRGWSCGSGGNDCDDHPAFYQTVVTNVCPIFGSGSGIEAPLDLSDESLVTGRLAVAHGAVPDASGEPDGQFLLTTAGAPVWGAGGAGTGTVTSVGLAAPAIFSVSGSPVTTAGTLTLALANETANTVFAGPTTGGAAAPTFRALVTNDLSAGMVTYAKIQNVSGTDKLLGRAGAGAGLVEEITCTAFVRTILDDVDAAAVRTTIGAGTSSFDGAYSSLTGVPSTFAPSAHHTSHETGGSDAITALAGSVITTGTVAAARLPSLDAIAAPAADVSLNSHKITSLVAGTAGTDAVNVDQLNAAVAALGEPKEVRCATAAALTELSYTNNGGVGDVLTLVAGVVLIDGQTLSVGDRVLIKNQANAAHNGLWIVTTVGALGVSAVFTRATDFDQEADGIAEALVFVLLGAANDDTRWVCATSGPITWGTTNINFAQFLGGVYTADETTLHLSGTTFSVKSLGVTDAQVATANKDGAAGTASMRTLGTGAAQACAGNDSRLSDARTPTAHAASHLPGGTDPLATAAPVASNPGDAQATGAAASFARSDHVHAREQLPAAFYDPTVDAAVIAGSTTWLKDDPLIVDSGRLVTLPATALLWLDATVMLEPALVDPTNYTPGNDVSVFPGRTVCLLDDPLVIAAGLLVRLPAEPMTCLWLHGTPQVQRVISGFLWLIP